MADGGYNIGQAYIQVLPSMDKFGSTLKGAVASADTEQMGKDSGSGFGRGFSAAISAIGTAIAGVGTAAVALAKNVVGAYGEYEQLAGGAKLMWGDAYDYIADKAASAFDNVQMSTNDYLTQANYYATGLKTALGGDTQAAAELADSIITAQADIIAATGNSAEAVQYAFNGVMRGNYTMLDNLGLGIAGTKDGMQSVINAVNEWKISQGEAGNLVIDSMADCEQALVDYVAMQGMAGYAAAEGANTIQGAFSKLAASWENLISGLGNSEADIKGLAKNVVDSFSDAFNQVLPVVENIVVAIPAVVEAFANAVPRLAQTVLTAFIGIFEALMNNLGPIVSTLLDVVVTMVQYLASNAGTIIPQLLDALLVVIEGVLVNLPTIITALAEQIPVIIESLMVTILEHVPTIIDAVIQIVTAIAEALPEIITAIIEILPTLITSICDAITANLPLIIAAGITLFTALIQDLPTIITAIITVLPQIIDSIITTLIGNIGLIVEAGITLITALVDELPTIIETIVAVLPKIIDSIITTLLNNIGLIIDAGITLLIALIDALPEIISIICTEIPRIVTSIVNALIDHIDEIILAGVQLLVALIENLPTAIIEIVKAAPQIISALVSGIGEGISQMASAGLNLVRGLWNGISSGISWLWGKVSGWLSGLWSDILGFFGIHSPSTEMAWVGEMMVSGLAGGITRNAGMASDAVTAMGTEILDTMDNISKDVTGMTLGADIVDSIDINKNVNARAAQSIETEYGSASASPVEAILEYIRAYFPEFIERMERDIVFDDGSLAARLLPKVNEGLGVQSTMEGRGLCMA